MRGPRLLCYAPSIVWLGSKPHPSSDLQPSANPALTLPPATFLLSLLAPFPQHLTYLLSIYLPLNSHATLVCLVFIFCLFTFGTLYPFAPLTYLLSIYALDLPGIHAFNDNSTYARTLRQHR